MNALINCYIKGQGIVSLDGSEEDVKTSCTDLLFLA